MSSRNTARSSLGQHELTLRCENRFDTSMSQKSAFKMQSQGVYVPRASFPQLPGSVCINPTFIQTKHGYVLRSSEYRVKS